MYQILSLLTGLVIAVMVALNGGLSLQYGVFAAAVIVHVVGVLSAYVFCRITKKRIVIKKEIPLWFYFGGGIGFLTTVFNNFAYGKISLTSIVALGLFGQTAISLLIDGLGLFGMEKHPFKKSSAAGLVFSLVGILVMLDRSVNAALYAVLVSFLAGMTVVLSRTVNAKLSHHVGELQVSFINHAVGLPFAVAAAVSLQRNTIFLIARKVSPELWIYLGGVLGVATVLLCNITVPRVSAFRLTLLTFAGQVFTGIAIDMVTKSGYTEASFTGGLLVATGIVLNMIYEQLLHRKENRTEEYREKVRCFEKEYRGHLLELAGKSIPALPDVVFETRPKNGICCPYCWTVQSSGQNSCRGYRCGAKFIFRDELSQTENGSRRSAP